MPCMAHSLRVQHLRAKGMYSYFIDILYSTAMMTYKTIERLFKLSYAGHCEALHHLLQFDSGSWLKTLFQG